MVSKKAYTDCVSQMSTAKADVSVANTTWASVITLWITTGLAILVQAIK